MLAAVELAADAGTGGLPRRDDLLDVALEMLDQPQAGREDLRAASMLAAAALLRGRSCDVSGSVLRLAAGVAEDFERDENRSKPIGFYTWNRELEAIFRRDRLLQEELDPPVALRLARAISSDEGAAKCYEASLTLSQRLTNPFTSPDLRAAVAALVEGTDAAQAIVGRACLFPPSRSHEGDLMNKLYGDSSIPEGFDLADEMVRRIRAGELDLRPGDESGWYDYQHYALEALVAAERTPERSRLSLSERYNRELAGAFKALICLARETHVKQLQFPKLGAAQMEPPSVPVFIQPNLSIEPLATYYLRQAESYRFVRRVLESSCGEQGLATIRRLRPDGPVEAPLSEELRWIESLFRGAYSETCYQLGIAGEDEVYPAGNDEADTDRSLLREWRRSAHHDPDLCRDIRAIVPVFYDLERKKIKVWLVLGLSSKPMDISFATPPRVVSVKEAGGRGWFRSARTVFAPARHRLVYLVAAETYVTRLLDRSQFRAHCDRHGTFDAIVDKLR